MLVSLQTFAAPKYVFTHLKLECGDGAGEQREAAGYDGAVEVGNGAVATSTAPSYPTALLCLLNRAHCSTSTMILVARVSMHRVISGVRLRASTPVIP